MDVLGRLAVGTPENPVSLGRYQVVGRGERDGESVYAVTGSCVYDATLGGRTQVILNNGITTIP